MRQIRALAVDDFAAMRRAIVDVLRAVPGCVVVGEAANGVEALELAGALRPELVVLDVHMPVMGGMEALRALKCKLPCAHVVMVSTAFEPETRQHALNLGADACLEKGRELWNGLPTLVLLLAQTPVSSVANP